ncbi:N-alpha-acetyltransferase 35, NatC auxiliary subunit [Onthophagus taurus]|uniref:N-alpha-acetyltransferase 35, NatC auxiliary subunit n=1 Tax=Onthophagus taurus TaxID=166361 RepID=UPI000C202DCE|nr:N-alpha-acetyltransferase 35, NatC auxiliary subunit [Onthophagus taurus]
MDYLEPDMNGAVHHSTKVNYNWVDITEDFLTSVKDLQLGELLHDNLFGLFEAMSAIEMMDPKMDAGMLCNRGTKKAKSFDQAVKDNSLKLEGLSYEEQIGIIDQTLACIVSWLEGHSLAQTVFTNLYLHNSYQIADRPLKAFCLTVYKLLEIIKDYIHKAMVYEEEDFQPMQYGYQLNPDISEQRIITMLREVEEELHRKMQNRDRENDIEGLVALFTRIKFMRVLYQVLIMLIQRKDDSPMIIDCHRLLAAASDMLFVMKKTVELGIQPPDENSHMMGFQPFINQRLLPPTFPRYTKIKPRKEAMVYFEIMIERFKNLTKIQSINSLHQALDFFIEFSKVAPCILSRSALQLLYVPNNTILTTANYMALKDILRDAAKQFISPPALVSKAILHNNQQARIYVDTFFAHCTRPFANFLQLCGHNRARQRDKLAHLLEEFTALQDEGERVDAYLHNISVAYSRPHLACFGTWILYHTLRIMIMYLLSGFELELYSIHEYYYIYWYLYEFLYGWLISALTRADTFLMEQERAMDVQKTKGTNKKKMKFKKKTRPHNRDILFYQALQNMCGGYYKALMGFRMDGKLTMPHPQFDSEQVRYEHRFAPFQNLLTPPPVQYVEFRDLIASNRYQQQSADSMYMYISGCKHFHQAKQLLETLNSTDGEILELLRIAKTNFIVLKLLAGGHRKDSSVPPEFLFKTNKHFPILKLT